MPIPIGLQRPGDGLIQVLKTMGLSSNIKLCLDAGDPRSVVTGSQVNWLDLSGGGYDFNRGATSASEATDPTYNGTVGKRSSGEYYSFDGGDYFTYDTTNETWMQNIHKDNAAVTVLCWYYTPTISVVQELAGDNDGISTGFNFNVRSNNTLRFGILNAGAVVRQLTSTGTISANTWTFLASSLNEASVNSGIMQVNGTQDTGLACDYVSPPSGNASLTMQIGALGSIYDPPEPGSRMGMFAILDTNLSATQLNAVYNATRGRYGV